MIRFHTPALRARHLSCGWHGPDEGTPLHDVCLDLYERETVLLLGPRGGGQNLLLAALSGLRRPDSGSVECLGTDLWGLTEDAAAEFRRSHCSFLLHGDQLLPDLTAREQLEAVLSWMGTDGPDSRRRADEGLELVGLTRKASCLPAQLSRSEQRRVAVARALIKGAAFIFADEPTSAVDWETGGLLLGLLRDYAHECGGTVVIASHDSRIWPYADQVYHVEDGELKEDKDESRHIDELQWETRVNLPAMASWTTSGGIGPNGGQDEAVPSMFEEVNVRAAGAGGRLHWR